MFLVCDFHASVHEAVMLLQICFLGNQTDCWWSEGDILALLNMAECSPVILTHTSPNLLGKQQFPWFLTLGVPLG